MFTFLDDERNVCIQKVWKPVHRSLCVYPHKDRANIKQAKMYEKGKPPIAITYAGAIMWGGSNMNLSVYKLHKLNNSPKIFCNEGKKLDFGEVNVCCVMYVCVWVCLWKKHEIFGKKEMGKVMSSVLNWYQECWFFGLCNAHTHKKYSGYLNRWLLLFQLWNVWIRNAGKTQQQTEQKGKQTRIYLDCSIGILVNASTKEDTHARSKEIFSERKKKSSVCNE